MIIKKEIKNQKNSKIILFSPSAASFDQFKNFEERGVYFNKLVRQIIIKKLWYINLIFTTIIIVGGKMLIKQF